MTAHSDTDLDTDPDTDLATDSPITEKMLEAYARDGFVVVRGLLGAEDLQRWNERLEAIVNGEVAPSEDMLVMKDVMIAKGAVTPGSKLEAIAKLQDYEKDPVLDTYTTHPDILGCIQRLIGEDVMTIHTMLINKPPNVDGRHPLHQDLLYFPFRPPERIAASWTALQDVTKQNGCLVVVPGSHTGGLLPHENPEWDYLNGGYFGAKDVGDAMAERVHLEMAPGDTVFFHPVLLHGSGRNRTQGFRRAISAHYASTTCSWEWKTQEFHGRHYRIVTGQRKGELWAGQRNPAIDPLAYAPHGSPLKDELGG